MKLGVEEIIEKALSDGALSPEEQEVFAEWMQGKENRKRYYELKRIRSAIYALKVSEKAEQEKAWEKLKRHLKLGIKNQRFARYAAAAVLVIGLSIPVGLLLRRSMTDSRETYLSQAVQPDAKQIVLTLSTGEQVTLSDSLSPLTEKNGTVIQNAGSQLVYAPTDTTSSLVYNTITVPRGGEYKLVLADHTVVWLNSESRLTYPVAFKGHTRELQLEGEAFFEVTQDTRKPFIVHTSRFDIRVTGTQFNVRSYPHETVSATLAKGNIQLEKGNQVYRLVPGQQAWLSGEEVKVKEVELEDAIAWRYDAFSFQKVPLEHLLNEISRWYDVHIFYLNPEVKSLHFTAWFRRSTPIQELLEILEKTQQVKLTLKGRTLIVAKQL